ncbi:MAG TPA: hypothetical protein VHW47_02140 [Acidimicrobiales bacterium]|jgi:hypothetical protein|nr:hypothetical protein [Acidimicrobiales bacterium]
MPSVTITRTGVTKEDAATALQAQLGSRYTVIPKDGSQDHLSVKQSTMVFASVRMASEPGGTTFHVHGGGLIIGRIINELTIARKVAAAIKAAPGLGA